MDYSATKKRSTDTTYMNLESMMLSERSLSQKTTHYIIPFYEMSNTQTHRESRLVAD